MSSSVQTATIETQVPSRLDRLPWSKFHWRVVVGLGTVWILDGLEVTMVGSVAARLTEQGSGIELTAGQIGLAASIYVLGACLGALFFGQLTDRFGRKKLFMITLVVYIVATVATAFSFAPWYFYLARFFTGAGIGGEYAAINSAIDELIPARVRGRVDLTINGSYWVGSAAGAGAAIFFLNEAIFPTDIGWRVAFAVGAILGVGILLVRRHVPESPRWLFIHGREEEAERIVGEIEEDVRGETGQDLPAAEGSLRVRQRTTIPFRMIAQTAFKLYPKRAVLGLALFVGQAFIYNGVTFNLGTLLSTFFGVASSFVPVFIVIWAIGNFLGPLLLGRLFDTLGRIPMISGTYLGSALLTVPLGILMMQKVLNQWTFLALLVAIFFLASAGASAAYLTVSEVFPMETRALAIAFFYAVGTAVGGITGPLLFGKLISDAGEVSIAFFIGAAVMAVGGIAEIFLGVRAERADLESIAKPLTAEEAEEPAAQAAGGAEAPGEADHTGQARRSRADAEWARARAAEHRAAAIELRADADGGSTTAAQRLRAEEVLAEIADLRGRGLDEQAAAHDWLATAARAGDEREAAGARTRAQAAEQRAREYAEREQSLSSEHDDEAERHNELAEAAAERARAREQRALAHERRHAVGGDEAAIEEARARMHDAWADMHEQRAQVHVARAEGNSTALAEAEGEAARQERAALAAEELVAAAEHRVGAESLSAEQEQTDAQRAEAAERQQRAAELEQRIRARLERREASERTGIRRFRPGPGRTLTGGRLGGSVQEERAAVVEQALDAEIEVIARALNEHGATDRQELARIVAARYWGPGRFAGALRTAVQEGRARRLSRSTYGPPED